MARRPTAGLVSSERWAHYLESDSAVHVEANGFVNFQLAFDSEQKRRVLSPRNYVIIWSNRDKGKLRYTSSLLTMRIIDESALPSEAQVGPEMRGRNAEFIEFELLCAPGDVSKQSPLAIVAGPVRVNAETDMREFMRIDMGRCLRDILTDVIDDPKHRSQRLSRRRWYICVEVIRLICSSNELDCSALDENSDAPPLEWVLCLSDDRAALAMAQSCAELQDKSIDELTKFIDGGSKKSKAKKKKAAAKEEEPEVEESCVYLAKAIAWQLPLGWMDMTHHETHLSQWRGLTRNEPTAVYEANRFLRLRLQPPAAGGRARPKPASCVLAMPQMEALSRLPAANRNRASNVPYFSSCLNMSVLSNDEIQAMQSGQEPPKQDKDLPLEMANANLLFELYVRQRNYPTPPPLRLAFGAVRVGGKKKEMIRLDLSRSIQWMEPELEQLTVAGHIEPVIKMRWWINFLVFNFVCKGRGLDCSGLQNPSGEPFEWMVCVYDDDYPGGVHLQEAAWAFRADLPGQGLRPYDSMPEKMKEQLKAQSADMVAEIDDDEDGPLALPASLVDYWANLISEDVPFIAKSDGFVHFEVRQNSQGHLSVWPRYWIIAFPTREKAGKQRYHTGLLTINTAPEEALPEGYTPIPAELSQPKGKVATGKKYIQFELNLRASEEWLLQTLQISIGPVRENPETLQCETLRIPLGRCLPYLRTNMVQTPLPGKKLLISTWFMAVDTLRLIATSNNQECGGLDDPAKPPTKWVMILADHTNAKGSAASETRSIDDLLDYIEAKDPVRSKKLRKKPLVKVDASPLEPRRPVPTAEEAAAAAAAAGAAAAAAVSGDALAQVKAAEELLALAMAQTSSPSEAFRAALTATQRLAAELTSVPGGNNRQPVFGGRPAPPPPGEASDEEEEPPARLARPKSASKVLAASLAAPKPPKPPRVAEGVANATLRDGFLSVSGLDAGGSLDLQGLLLEGLRDSLANLTPAQILAAGAQPAPDQAPDSAESSASRRAPKKRR